MTERAGAADAAMCGVGRKSKSLEAAVAQGMYEVVCRDRNGVEKWRDTAKNLIVNAGLNYLLDAGLSGGSAISSWYLGLTDGTPTVVAGDTMGSHDGWTEVTAYDESNRQAWSEGGPSGQSITNSGSPAVFTISTNSTTVGGLFLSSSNSKSGSTGTLFGAAAFSAGDKELDDGDTLTVTYSASLSAS